MTKIILRKFMNFFENLRLEAEKPGDKERNKVGKMSKRKVGRKPRKIK